MNKKGIYIFLGAIAIVSFLFFLYKKYYKQNSSALNIEQKQFAGTVQPKPAYKGVDSRKWKAGDILYSAAPTVNLYQFANASTAGIINSFPQGMKIGVFISIVGNFAFVQSGSSKGYVFLTNKISNTPNVTT